MSTSTPGTENFQDGLSLLQEQLPGWWPKDNPASRIYAILTILGGNVDNLSNLFEAFADDRVLTNSTLNGLERTWEPLWGVQNEQLPQVQAILVPYIQARMAEDGSVQSLINTLMAMILATPINVTTGPLLLFDAGGAGVTFPATGGLPLWQWDGITNPLPSNGLFFPANGTGLTFPFPNTVVLVDDELPAHDGTSGTMGYAYPMIFTVNGFVSIIQNFTAYQFTVRVKSELVFDRPAFARAVQRFRPAHTLPPIIQEVP